MDFLRFSEGSDLQKRSRLDILELLTSCQLNSQFSPRLEVLLTYFWGLKECSGTHFKPVAIALRASEKIP